MSSDRELSNLSLSRKECPKCRAVWINGEHRWSGTGNRGSELDLASLVCNDHGDEQCINPMKGQVGGDTWEKRMEDLDAFGEKYGEGKTDWWNNTDV